MFVGVHKSLLIVIGRFKEEKKNRPLKITDGHNENTFSVRCYYTLKSHRKSPRDVSELLFEVHDHKLSLWINASCSVQ